MVSNILIYCGAHSGNDPIFLQAASQLAQQLAHYKLSLVYGGASIGIMGAMADHMLALQRPVFGVITKDLAKWESAHENLTDLTIVSTMQQRKMRMLEMADAIILMPGGFGSFDEFFECMVLKSLGYHNKPCGIYNVANYYDVLGQFLQNSVDHGFIPQSHLDAVHQSSCAKTLVEMLINDNGQLKPLHHSSTIEQGNE